MNSPSSTDTKPDFFTKEEVRLLQACTFYSCNDWEDGGGNP